MPSTLCMRLTISPDTNYHTASKKSYQHFSLSANHPCHQNWWIPTRKLLLRQTVHSVSPVFLVVVVIFVVYCIMTLILWSWNPSNGYLWNHVQLIISTVSPGHQYVTRLDIPAKKKIINDLNRGRWIHSSPAWHTICAFILRWHTFLLKTTFS